AIGLLSLVLPAVAAAKLWLAVYLSLSVLVMVMLWRRTRDGGQVFLLLAVVVLGPGFWNGYINFQFALMLFALCLLLARQQFVVTLLFSLLIFFSHAAVFAVLVAYTLFSAMLNTSVPVKTRCVGPLALVPALLLLCWYTLVLLSDNRGTEASSMGLFEWVQYKFYTLAKQGPFHNFILPSGESLLQQLNLLYWAGFAANFAFALLLLLWFWWLIYYWLQGSLSPLRSDAGGTVLLFALCIAVCLALYLLAGANTFGVVNLGERFLIVALMIALIQFRNPTPLQWLMVSVSVVFTVGVLVAGVVISQHSLEQYAVDRSSTTSDLTDYVDDIYAASRHQYFNHRLFIYADRGLELLQPSPALLDIDLETSVIRRVR
ncbi:MAG: hypothetical protein AAF404_03565, partial [Pseudomonadota bacterium]